MTIICLSVSRNSRRSNSVSIISGRQIMHKAQLQLNREKAQRRSRTGERQQRDGSQCSALLDMKADKAGRQRGAQERQLQRQLDSTREALTQESIAAPAVVRWHFPALPKRRQPYARAVGLVLPYGQQTPLNLTVETAHHWHIRGVNGSGKSTLLAVLHQQLAATAGSISITGETVLLTQHHAGTEPIMTSTLEYFQQHCLSGALAVTEIRTILAAAGLDALKCNRPVAALSGGERMRLNILLAAWSRHGALLLLDEPDNHLDMDSRQVLSSALNAWPGSWLLVSHDDDFAAQCGVTHVLNLHKSE
ncbi:MAG: hypothetical protein CMI03_00365 [Oceanospirillaceae bacterium]|nr:hypothetical protein [Oceanospirillaceae bacterium]MBL35602.1 hypothetical protein [Oceanospirillaceae bacterium]MBS51199.1 hypothetical protein [Oceanospirillaceae bacterium]